MTGAGANRAAFGEHLPFSERLAAVRLVVFDFDGVFTDNAVYVTQDGMESVRCWRSDGLGLSRLRSVGVKTMIVSSEKNSVVSLRAEKLEIPCKYGVTDKRQAVNDICRDAGIDLMETMFVGNDINDVPALRAVGVPVIVADAHSEVWPYALYRTARPGGYGAVREVCDLIFEAHVAARAL